MIETYSDVPIRLSALVKEKFDKFHCLLSKDPCAKQAWKSNNDSLKFARDSGSHLKCNVSGRLNFIFAISAHLMRKLAQLRPKGGLYGF